MGKEVKVQQVDDTAYADVMKSAGVPDVIIQLVVDIQRSIREGHWPSKAMISKKTSGETGDTG